MNFTDSGKTYQAVKNHYYLIQIGHMIAQIMEAWENLWKKIKQSMEQKHKRIMEAFKNTKLEEHIMGTERRIQIRFT